MSTTQVQGKILKELRSANAEMSLSELMNRVGTNDPSSRREVKAAVVPLLYLGQITLTPSRKFLLSQR